MRWKFQILGAVGIVVAVGCGFAGQETERERVVHYYQFSLPRSSEAFAELVELFHEEHPEIKVEVHTLPQTTDDQHQFYLTRLSSKGKSLIDVLAIDVIWLAEFAEAGVLMPLDARFDETVWNGFFPSSVRAASYRGERFGIPFFIDGGALYWRADLLKKYGYEAPPTTYRELIQMARDVLKGENDPALHGFVWQGRQYEGLICNFIEFLPATAKPLLAEDQSALNFNQAAVRETLRFMRDLVFKYRVSPESVFSMSEEESRHVFHNGKAVFMRNWPYAWRLAQQKGSPVAGKIRVSPLPSMTKGRAGRGALGGFLLGINRNTPYPEAALAWTRFLVSERAQRIVGEKLGLTPARKNVVS
ncbi:MAG: extracellular solute-binding protein, partial [Nitrospinales bacterium]